MCCLPHILLLVIDILCVTPALTLHKFNLWQQCQTGVKERLCSQTIVHIILSISLACNRGGPIIWMESILAWHDLGRCKHDDSDACTAVHDLDSYHQRLLLRTSEEIDEAKTHTMY